MTGGLLDKRIAIWPMAALGLVFLLAAAGWLATRTEPRRPPSFETVQSRYVKSDALLLDRHGRVIHELRVDPRGRRLEWLELKEVSPAFIRVLLAAEDRRFYQHRGVDWRAVGAAVLTYPWSEKIRGASTISMQLSALLDKRLKPSAGRRNWRQKWRQIQAARALEQTWSKEQILEAYLNLVSYRSELQGLSSAARGLFDKKADGLTENEALLLVSLISAPNAPADRVVRRALGLNKTLGARATPGELAALAEAALRGTYLITPAAALAPHVARRLLERGVVRTWSTLDARLQRLALETLNHHLDALRDDQVHDGAVLVLDNRSGEVLAYVGNSGDHSSAPWVDGVTARRQAGSTLKPFLYALAVEKKLLTPASLLDDSPLQVPTPTGLYIPRNYDNQFRGPVSLRTALSASINVPAVRTLLLVGLEPFRERLGRLGFESLTEDAEYYGYSLALGSADVTLWELANAYRVLARQGQWSPLKLQPQETTGRRVRVLDQRAAAIVADILSDREARSPTFGLENPLSTRFWTAVKTGTSKDMRDNWCLGFSERYTVGVWVGNFSGEPMRRVSGVSGAAPVWLDLMNTLHARLPSRPPRLPAGVVTARISCYPDSGAPREEYFIQGTEPGLPVRPTLSYREARIIYPLPETLISLDPEIPEDRQRVPCQFHPPSPDLEWVLDDRKTGIRNPLFLWNPMPGNHRLVIVDKEDRILDSVRFSVK